MSNILEQKISVRARITTYGIPFNGSVINYVGENAVHKMIKILNRLANLQPNVYPVSIDGGTSSTMIPEICHAEFEIQMPQSADMDVVKEKINVILKEACPSGGVEINFI